MVTATGAFTTKPNFRVEISANVIGWTAGNTAVIVEVIAGIRRTSGTGTDSGTATFDVGNGSSGGTYSAPYNFASTDYVEIYRQQSQRTIAGSTDTWNITVSATTTLGTASATNAPMTYPAATGATQPSFSPTVFNAGTAITISLPRQVGTYTHDVLYSFGSISNSILATGVGTSYSTTPPVTLGTEIPGAIEGPYTITAITRTSAGVEVGRLSFTGTLRMPSSQNPTVSAYAVSDTNATVVAQVGAFVQSLSVLKLDSVTATGKQGATITERRLSIEGASLQINDTRALLNSGTIPVTARAWDSRGLEGTLAGNVTVLAYSGPSNVATVFRSNASSVPTEQGASLSVTFNAATIQSLVNTTQRNAMTLRISTSPFGSGTWTVRNTVTPTTSLITGRLVYNGTILVGGGAIYDPNLSYSVRVEVLDKFNAVAVEHTVATAYVTIDMNGSSVGVGKLHQRGTLDVGGQGHFRGLYTTPEILTNANLAVYGGTWMTTPSTTNLPSGGSANNGLIEVVRELSGLSIDLIVHRFFNASGSVSWVRFGLVDNATNVATWDPWFVSLASGRGFGTTAQMPTTGVYDGATFYATDTDLLWQHDGTKWLLAPGQRLAYMSANVTSGVANTILGTVIRTPSLPIGQRVRVRCGNISMQNSAAGPLYYAMALRNNASDVTASVSDKSIVGRGYVPASGIIVSVPASSTEYVTTVAAQVTAALYVAAGITYGSDVQELWIESA